MECDHNILDIVNVLFRFNGEALEFEIADESGLPIDRVHELLEAAALRKLTLYDSDQGIWYAIYQ